MFPAKVQTNRISRTVPLVHKYVVNTVETSDLSGAGSSDLVTNYTYLGSPAWAWQDRPGIKAKNRSYSQWRGYRRVRTVQGASANATPGVSETLYYRGMHGDRLTDTTTHDVQISDSNSTSTDDHWRLAGMPRKTETFTSVGGARLTSTISTYATQTVSTLGRNVVMAP